jgi:hypothetical protein
LAAPIRFITSRAGDQLYANFSSGLPAGAVGDGALYGPNYGTACFGDNCVASPGTSASSLTTGQFFAVLPGQTETFAFGYAASDVSVYIGSLDDENSLTINYAGGGSMTTPAMISISGQTTPIPGGDATIYGAMTNGFWTSTDPSRDIIGITVTEGSTISSNSFEIAEITTSIPEPSTWAMMMAGFAGLAFTAFRARRSAAAVA